MIKKFLILFIIGSFLLNVSAAEFSLMNNRKAAAEIVIAADASEPVKFAASELADFLAKISSGEKPSIVTKPTGKKYPVRIAVQSNKSVASRCNAKLVKQLKPDGFILKADKNGLTILGSNDRGALYGAYEVLKQYGDIRWLYPGETGEYFQVKSTIAIPEGEKLHNPSFAFRSIFHGSCFVNSFLKETWLWQTRNNSHVEYYAPPQAFSAEARAFQKKIAPQPIYGGHVFSILLCGKDNPMELYKKHPEYFPMINGKRIPLDKQKYQPCTSNPEVIKRMITNLKAEIKKRCTTPDSIYLIGNNDGTGWCQCDNCRALDPEEERKNNIISTRYWTITNQLAEAVWKEMPNQKLWGWAYQNFSKAPAGINPNPKLTVELTYNSMCRRHPLDDPKCPVNSNYYSFVKEWVKKGMRFTTWEQVDAVAFEGWQPIERTFIDYFLRHYHKLGFDGPRLISTPFDGVFRKDRQGKMITRVAQMQWMHLYLTLRMEWDMSRDINKEYEEAGKLFYGKAWEGGMKQFRELLTKCANQTPGCYGWGPSASPVGRCLDQPGTQEQLKKYMAQAQKAAQGDPKAAEHVAWDALFFKSRWLDAREQYVSGYREITSYRRTAPIVIDGKADEADWKKADVISEFSQMAVNPPTKAKHQTYVRITHDSEYLYFLIEAMEPMPGQMKNTYSPDQPEKQTKLWHDAGAEIFINHPDLGNRYYHYILTVNGAKYDSFCTPPNRGGDQSFTSRAEWKTAIQKDRWILEIKIPTAELGMKAFDGTRWKINVARNRLILGKPKEEERSSLGFGNYHNVENFIPLAFALRRSTASNGRESNTIPWKNPGFDKTLTTLTGQWKKWTVPNGRPAGWQSNHKNGNVELPFHPGSTTNRYLKLKGGTLFQIYDGNVQDISIRMRVSGKGSFMLAIYPYEKLANGKLKNKQTVRLATVPVNSSAWKELSFTYTAKHKNETPGIAIYHKNGEINIDDVQVIPVNPGKRPAKK